MADKHYRVSNIDREDLFQRGVRQNNDLEVFVSLYHNSVVLYLVAPNREHVHEIVNLRTIAWRPSLASFSQDRTTPLASRTEDIIRPILIGAIIDFCNATTTGYMGKILRSVQGGLPELESANGVKTCTAPP